MNNNTKQLISEISYLTNSLCDEDVILFFKEKKYKKMKSYSDEKDLNLLVEYINESRKINITQINHTNNKNDVQNIYITLIETNDSLTSIGRVIKIPYLKYENKDLIVDTYIEQYMSEESFYQFNSIVDNINEYDHSIEFIYYLYTENSEHFIPVTKIDPDNILESEKNIYFHFLQSSINNVFDKDLNKLLVELLNRLK